MNMKCERNYQGDGVTALTKQKIGIAELEARLYPIGDAAAVAGICTSKMWGLIRDGKIPAVTIGKRKFVSPKTLQALLDGELLLAE